MQIFSLIMRTIMVLTLSVSVLYLQGCCKDKKKTAKPPAQGSNFTPPAATVTPPPVQQAPQPGTVTPPAPEVEQPPKPIVNDLGDGPEVTGEQTPVLNQVEGDGPE